ncbi:MAG: hypothetical protein E7598_02370 [Ruminococcaceae bacterium]|nr:hypothetical protein [Oscillospiraceae bacterium]
MKFFKDNASMIYRMLITHIGMAVFGLVLFLATNLQGAKTMLLAGLFSAVFYCVIVYTTMWEYGAKDKPAYDAGRREKAGRCGFFTCLTAEAVFIAVAIVYFICSYFEAANGVATVCYIIEILFNGCFTGIMLFVKNALANDIVIAPIYILGSVIVSAVGAFGYVLGSKDMRIIPKKTEKK